MVMLMNLCQHVQQGMQTMAAGNGMVSTTI